MDSVSLLGDVPGPVGFGLGAVYDASHVPRSACDILPANDTERQAAQEGPNATNTWLAASIEQDVATVIARVFDETHCRDPDHSWTWVALR